MKEESIIRSFRNVCLLLILPVSFLIWTSFAVSAGSRPILEQGPVSDPEPGGVVPVEIGENRVGQATPGNDGKVSPEASPTVTPTVLPPDPPVGPREVDPSLEEAKQDEADPTNDGWRETRPVQNAGQSLRNSPNAINDDCGEDCWEPNPDSPPECLYGCCDWILQPYCSVGAEILYQFSSPNSAMNGTINQSLEQFWQFAKQMQSP